MVSLSNKQESHFTYHLLHTRSFPNFIYKAISIWNEVKFNRSTLIYWIIQNYANFVYHMNLTWNKTDVQSQFEWDNFYTEKLFHLIIITLSFGVWFTRIFSLAWTLLIIAQSRAHVMAAYVKNWSTYNTSKMQCCQLRLKEAANLKCLMIIVFYRICNCLSYVIARQSLCPK